MKSVLNQPNVFVYRLKYCPNSDIDTVDLQDDDDDVDIKDVKNIPKFVGTTAPLVADIVIPISDSDDDADNVDNGIGTPPSEDTFDYDRFCNSPEPSQNDEPQKDFNSETMQYRDYILADFPLPERSTSLHMEIKEEVVDMSYAYERDMVRKSGNVKSEFRVVDIIELSDDSQGECLPSADLNTDATTSTGCMISPSIVDDQFADKKEPIDSSPWPKKTKTEYSCAGNESKQIPIDSNAQTASTKASALFDTSYQDDLTTTVGSSDLSDFNRPASVKRPQKPRVKWTSRTHGVQLAEDLLAASGLVVKEDLPAIPEAIATRPHHSVAESRNIQPEKSMKPGPKHIKVPIRSIEMELAKNESIPWDALTIICDVTRWDARWIAKGLIKPKILYENFDMLHVRLQYDSLISYQRSVEHSVSSRNLL